MNAMNNDGIVYSIEAFIAGSWHVVSSGMTYDVAMARARILNRGGVSCCVSAAGLEVSRVAPNGRDKVRE